MLSDYSHSSWKNPDIALQYLERLGDCKSAFEDAIDLVSQDLVAIRGVLADFEVPSGEPTKLLKKRVKYALKEGVIERSLASLAEKTRGFQSLIDLTDPPHHRLPSTSCSFALSQQLSRFCRVKETAEDLYAAFGQACTKHAVHRVHLSLEPACAHPAQIQFTVAFSQLKLGQDPTAMDPLSKPTWLTVESSVSGRIRPTSDEAVLVTTQKPLKRALEDTAPSEKKQHGYGKGKGGKKCLRFQDQVVQMSLDPSRGLLVPLANICKHSNFCTQLQSFINQSSASRSAVGYLELSDVSKHLIYIDSKWQTVQEASLSSELHSLHDLLTEPAEAQDSSRKFSLLQQIRLAKQLATAVLQFHATPWLRSWWNSKDVLVDLEGRDGAIDTRKPEAYVTAQIHGPHGTLNRTPCPPSPVVVRNQLLFGLGVMLLELAFQRPLSSLVLNRDKDASDAGNTHYATADRLSRQVSAHMGPRYGEITRKCVHCDFGCDFDLEQTKPQEGFHQDVVRELEQLEQRMRDL